MKQLILLFFTVLTFFKLTAQCGIGFSQIKIEVKTDNYSNETSWQLKDKLGIVILSNPTLSNGTVYTSTLCVATNSCLTFSINDSFGDGICCNYGTGYFNIYIDNVLQIANNGQYGHSTTINFNCAQGESCTSAIPINTGLYTSPGSEFFYKFKPTTSGIYSIETCSLINTCDTKLSVYENCNGPFTNNNTGTILFNDDFCGVLSHLSGALDTSKTYIIRVNTNNNCNDSIRFSITYDGPITGCTTYSACNYNPLAAQDDGSCLYYPNPLCQAPDLTIIESQFKSSLTLGTVVAGAGDCRIIEGCLNGYGSRTVIQFDTYIKNIGNLDYYIGGPSLHPSQFSFNNCHGHAHYEGYAEYKLHKSTGQTLPIGFKNGFCVLDFDGCVDGGIAKYSCSNMGITKQCGDIYAKGLDCQWIDITDVDTGNYVMTAKVNWDQSADALGHYEKTYSNNTAQACVKITKDALGNKGFVVLTSCPTFSDCAGTLNGNASLDCNGICGGTTKMGDLDNNTFQQNADAQLYVSKILDNTISPNNCNDLFTNNKLTVFDAALMVNCARHNTVNNGKCLFPRGNQNPNVTAEFTIGNFDISQNYFDVYVKNPTAKILGYEFNISGATILNVVSLANATIYPVNPDFIIGGTKVISLAYNDSTIPKNNISQPICRVYYQNASNLICLDTIIDVVNKEYEAINSTRVNNCFLTTGFATKVNADYYFSVIPNPASDIINVTGFTKIEGNTLIQIKDIAGRILFSENKNFNGMFNYPIDINNYKAGIYFITITSKLGIVTKPIVVAK